MEHLRTKDLASLSLRSELQHISHLREGRRRPHHGYEGGLLVEIFIEADDSDIDEPRVANGVVELFRASLFQASLLL